MKDNNNNDDSWNKELSGAVDDIVDVTDRTMGRMSNFISSYSDRLFDRLDDLSLPVSLPLGWHTRRRCGGHNNDEALSINEDRAPETCKNLWAYPVPSFRQYNKCIDNDGTSVWNQDGVWRCLFPRSVTDLDLEGKNAADPEDRRWFKDYSVFLDWRRAMYKAQEAKREEEWKRIQEERSLERGWGDNVSSSVSAANNNNSNNGIRYVSESDAEKQGKRVISSSIMTETVSREDGSLETKRIVKKWYDDNTVSMSETVDNKPDGDKKGWFWN